MSEQTSKMPELPANSQELYELYLFLEGFRQAKGNILPLGAVHVENLFRAFQYLRSQNM